MKTNKDIPDNEIINKILNGKQELYTVLVNKYQDMVRNVISKTVKKTYDIDDLTNETFFKAYQHLNTYSDKFKFSTWICTIAKNKSIDYYRVKKTNQFVYIDDFEYEFIERVCKEKLEEKTISIVLQEKIDQSLDKLGERNAEIIRAYFYNGLSAREIGLKYNMTEGNVRSSIYRSRHKLKEDKDLYCYLKAS